MQLSVQGDFDGDIVLRDIDAIQKICQSLMKSERYRKMGASTIELIVCRARAIGIHPLEALNGALIEVKGKIEMSAQLMNALIRSKGHSITQVEYNDKICVLRGKRRDSGDEFTAYFSIDDAQRAGIAQNNVWRQYPRSMLFARALSILARTLFPDIIRDCYVIGEIDSQNQRLPTESPEGICEKIVEEKIATLEVIDEAEAEEIALKLDAKPELKEKIETFLREKYRFDGVKAGLPREIAERILAKASA